MKLKSNKKNRLILFLGGSDGLIFLNFLINKNSDQFKILNVLLFDRNDNIIKLCKRRKLNYHLINNIKTISLDFEQLKDSILVSCGFQKKIPDYIINDFNKKAINIHAAILPKYRGIHGGIWAQINKEKHLGSTCHYLNEKIDGGNILHISKFKNDIKYSRDELTKKLHKSNYDAFLKGFKLLLEGDSGISQSNNFKNWPKRSPEDSFFTPSSMDVNSFIHFHRALNRIGIYPFFIE